jgi:hypothetical protein
MAEAVRFRTSETALSTVANTFATTTANTEFAHNLLRIYNANAAAQAITINPANGASAMTFTLPSNAVIIIDKESLDTVNAAANSTGVVAAVVAYTY